MILTIGNNKIKALIDTGSTTSLLDQNILLQYKRFDLKTPIYFTSLNGRTNINQEIITNLPKEFGETATMSWKLAFFHGKYFDAILGQNILKPLGAVVDMERETLSINNNIIEFVKICPFEEHEINQLEMININDKVLEILYKGLNNEEQFSLDRPL